MSDDVIILYRIVRTNPPTVDDMRSHIDIGIPLRRTDPESLRMASGISLFDSIDRARQQAQRKPWLGNAFIAELAIPWGPIRVEKTSGPNHYTAWDDADDMLNYVKRIERA